MIGGIVTEVIHLENKVWINTVEKGERQTGRCAIYVERNDNSMKVRPGDSLWWQSGFAMWTPFKHCGNDPSKPGFVEGRKSGKDYDIRIPRVGFSGVSKPTI